MKTKTQVKNKPKQSQSIDLTRKLATLKKAINTGHNTTEMLIKSTKEKGREALNEAILTGKALLDAKAIIPFGGFLRWLKKECPKISEDTAQRYMKLAKKLGHPETNSKDNTAHVRNLPITNLREAYIMLGIINDPVESSRDDAQPALADDGTSVPLMHNRGANTGSLTTGVTIANQSTKSNAVSSPTTPAKSRSIVKIEQPKPTLSEDDLLSRPRFLVKELQDYLMDKLNSKSITKDQVESAVLQPLRDMLKDF